MNTLHSLVEHGYNRLQNKLNNGVDGGKKVFHEWVNGYVLLTIDETRQAIDTVEDGDYRILIRNITRELQSIGQQRLVPTIGIAKNTLHDLIVYVVLPKS